VPLRVAVDALGGDRPPEEIVAGAVAAAGPDLIPVVYGPVDEPWGVRRFFVRDPDGVVISVLAHD